MADESLVDEAMAVAEMVCRQPPEVLRSTKKLMRASILQGFEDIMSLSARYQVMAHLTDDHREALDAIHEARQPVFSGS